MRRIQHHFTSFGIGAKKMFFVALFGLVTISLKAQAPVSGTFTINAALPSTGNNFQTFTEASLSLLNGVNGPVVFNVAPNSGPYNEQINIGIIAGVSATNTITFNGNGNTMNNTSSNPTSRAVIKLDGAKHIIIDSLTLIAITDGTAASYGWGVGIIHDADSNIVRKCTITVGNNTTNNVQNNMGIFIGGNNDYPDNNGLSDCDGNLIDGNTIVGGYCGIVLDSYAGNFSIPYSPMVNNKIINNKVSGFNNAAIYAIWNANTLIEGNEIYGPLFSNGYGVYINEKNTGLKITGNKIHNISLLPSAASTAIDFNPIRIVACPADNILNANSIVNNSIYDIRNPNSQNAISISSSAFVNIYHNTIVLDSAGAASGSVTYGITIEGGNSNVDIKNNISIVTRSGSGTKYALNIASGQTAITSDYNDLFVSSGNYVGGVGSTKYATLALWQAAAGLQDAHSISKDPIFAGLATGNLTPTDASMDGLGKYVGVANDINGAIRNNNTPDIGAYEFLTPICVSSVTAGAAVGLAPVNSVCSGNQVTLNLINNSFGTGQKYKWQSSSTSGGTYTDINTESTNPAFDIYPTTNLYYRSVVTCYAGTAVLGTAISAPIQVGITPALSGTYTINKAFPTSISTNNFQSFNDAFYAFKCGIAGPVVLNVVPNSGPYNEQLIIDSMPAKTASKSITIKGNGNTLNYLSTNTNERAIIKLNGADYITIDSLNITALGTTTSQYGYGIQLINNADHNVIKNCTITVNATLTSPNYAGIVISGSATDAQGGSSSFCDSNKIANNTVIGGYYGIALYSDPTIGKIYYDTVTNNIVKDMHYYGIYLTGTDHALIEGNDVSRPTRTTTGSTFIGIYLNGVSTSLTVSKNKIHHAFAAMLGNSAAVNAINSNNCDGTAAAKNIISNNLIYRIDGVGAQVGLFNTGSDYTLYYHNTVSLESKNGASTTTARGIYQTTTAVGLEYKNNIISVKRSSTGVNTGIYMATTGTTFTADYNDFYIGSASSNKVGTKGSTLYSTLSDWQTGSGVDAHSLAINPIFTDTIVTNNYTPTETTLDNKGTPVGILTDINNATRSTSVPDMGAIEFTVPLPVKLVEIAAIKNSTDVLVSWSTASEINSQVFEVERSSNGVEFHQIGTVNANGNTTNRQYYQYTDKEAVTNATTKVLYYRLRMVDKDGSFQYSTIVTVQLGKNFETVKVFPNPVVSELFASIITDAPSKATIKVVDVTGRIILTQVQQVAQGSTTIAVNGVDKLQKGMYLVVIDTNEKKYVFKITK